MSWGARAADWARIEEQHGPVYDEALRRLEIEPGQRVLDVGCGAGVFLAQAVARGAEPAGVDAAPELLELAAGRVPQADLQQADFESLPFPDDRFDVVTGFTSFFLAADMIAALREAARVARPGGAVFVQVWGNSEHCQLEAMKPVTRPYMDGRSGPPAEPLWRDGGLERLAAAAGLDPETAFDLRFAYEFAEAEELGRLLLAPLGLGERIGPEREPEVREQIVAALAGCRRADGSYRVENEYRCLIARAS